MEWIHLFCWHWRYHYRCICDIRTTKQGKNPIHKFKKIIFVNNLFCAMKNLSVTLHITQPKSRHLIYRKDFFKKKSSNWKKQVMKKLNESWIFVSFIRSYTWLSSIYWLAVWTQSQYPLIIKAVSNVKEKYVNYIRLIA